MYQGSNEQVTIYISKCLGEIGAVNLEQSALPKVDDALQHVISVFSGSQQNHCMIFHMLNQYLVDDK